MQDLLSCRDIFYKFCFKYVGNGLNTQFQEDEWLGGKPLCDRIHRLYNVNMSFNISPASVLNSRWVSIKFKRTLRGFLLDSQLRLQEICKDVVLNEEKDTCRWNLTGLGNFSVKSMYNMLKGVEVDCPYNKLWFIKVPLKVKVFFWLMFRNSILTKDNLLARGWTGSEKCRFCNQN